MTQPLAVPPPPDPADQELGALYQRMRHATGADFEALFQQYMAALQGRGQELGEAMDRGELPIG